MRKSKAAAAVATAAYMHVLAAFIAFFGGEFRGFCPEEQQAKMELSQNFIQASNALRLPPTEMNEIQINYPLELLRWRQKVDGNSVY
jgi:hypothetical protein